MNEALSVWSVSFLSKRNMRKVCLLTFIGLEGPRSIIHFIYLLINGHMQGQAGSLIYLFA